MTTDKTAVLVVDVQMGNFDQSAPVFGSRDLLSKISALIAQARAAGVLVAYIQHCGPKGAIDQPGTPGWRIHPTVSPLEGDLVVQKRHPDAFQVTSLQSELERRGITTLVVAGIQTEYCIDATCRRAYSLGYKVTLVEDAHSTWDSDHLTASQIIEHHNAVLGGWFAELKALDEIAFPGAD
jgi:nicotinamidase-related amidase